MFSGRYADAQQNAENAILLNQNNSMAHALRGWALYFQEDFLNAEAALQRALELDPNNAMAHAYYAELIADLYTRGQASLDAVDKMSAEFEHGPCAGAQQPGSASCPGLHPVCDRQLR